MAKIVSANYRDRHSEYRWLVRDEIDDPANAQPSKSVLATGVNFTASGTYEASLGCLVVARCESAVGSDREVAPAPKGRRLSYLLGFFWDDRGEFVESCDNLILCADGAAFVVAATEISTRIALSAPAHVLEMAIA